MSNKVGVLRIFFIYYIRYLFVISKNNSKLILNLKNMQNKRNILIITVFYSYKKKASFLTIERF